MELFNNPFNNSLHTFTTRSLFKTKNKYDSWTTGVLKKSVSKYMLANKNLNWFIELLDKIIAFFIIEISEIKNFWNFAKQKDDIDAT
jgi:hypothetical protein